MLKNVKHQKITNLQKIDKNDIIFQLKQLNYNFLIKGVDKCCKQGYNYNDIKNLE